MCKWLISLLKLKWKSAQYDIICLLGNSCCFSSIKEVNFVDFIRFEDFSLKVNYLHTYFINHVKFKVKRFKTSYLKQKLIILLFLSYYY